MAAIGMMEGAFFVGRKEILDWINSSLDLNVPKIEDTASGAIACQLLDIMHPGQVPMAKVNWAAKQSFEFVGNYKILQTCFAKLHIDKTIDVDRLIRGQYMDNLEFLQWFKRFFEMSVQDLGDYNAVAQRCKGKGGSTYIFGDRSKSSSVLAKPTTRPPAPVAIKKVASGQAKSPSIQKENAAPTAAAPLGKKPVSGTIKPSTAPAGSSPTKPEVVSLRRELDEKSKAVSDLKNEIDGLEKERDFYFEKLRDIEVLLQEVEDGGNGNDVTASIFKILYATAEGFEPVVGEGAVESDGAGDVADTEETY